jgi:hypothetical protein
MLQPIFFAAAHMTRFGAAKTVQDSAIVTLCRVQWNLHCLRSLTEERIGPLTLLDLQSRLIGSSDYPFHVMDPIFWTKKSLFLDGGRH